MIVTSSSSSRLATSVAGLLVFSLAAALPAFSAAPEPASGTRAMVVSPHAVATRAGAEMLEVGGNAVDAAVAASFALGVAQPQSNGIGGGGFLLIRLADGRAIAIDARDRHVDRSLVGALYCRSGLQNARAGFGLVFCLISNPGLTPGVRSSGQHPG